MRLMRLTQLNKDIVKGDWSANSSAAVTRDIDRVAKFAALWFSLMFQYTIE